VFTNFLNLWILARVVTAGVATALCVVGGALGLHIACHWRAQQSSEEQLALERRAELVASVMQVAVILEFLGLILFLLVADHLVGRIRGTMCAFGVLASTRAGYYGLASSLATGVVGSLWLMLHRLDLRLAAPLLTRRKFAWLPVVGLVALVDFRWVLAFAYELDFQVIASCCSIWVDETVLKSHAARLLLSPWAAGGLALVAAGMAAAASFLVWRQPRRSRALTASLLSLLAPFAVLPAVLGVVAPHALETPAHLCPFCLLHAQGHYLGWPLFASLLTGTTTGLGLGVIEFQRLRVDDPSPILALQRSLARWSWIAWSCALACSLWPIAQYWCRSGGVSVFG
jgi:hypothetical protein